MVCVHAGPCPPDCHHPSDPWLSHSLCFVYKLWCQEGHHREKDQWWQGVSEQMEVLARNLAEVTEDIWIFFQQLPAFGKMRRGDAPGKMRLFKK